MKFSFSFKLFKVAFPVSLFFFLLGASFVHADAATTGTIFMTALGDEAANGYFIVEAKPGEKKKITVNLRNTSDSAPATGEFMVADAPNAKGGGIGAIDPQQPEQHEVGSWFQMNKTSVQLKPGESRDVTLDFTLPADTGPGDHVGAISLYKFEAGAKPNKPLDKNEAAVVVNKAYSQIIAVLVKVPGAIRHQLEVKSLETKMNGSSLFVDITIANIGNVIEDSSQGVVQISQGGKPLFEKKGQMNSIYPGHSAIFSFEAPADLVQRGRYDLTINWFYASGKQELHTTIPFEISQKQVKQAVIADLAKKGDQNISKNVILLNPSDIWRYLTIAVVAVIILFVIIVAFIKRKRKSSRPRSQRPYPTIEG